MEGDREITVYQPPAATEDQYGQRRRTGQATVHSGIWAKRRDRGGGEQITADAQIADWQTAFEVRVEGLEGIEASWYIQDEDDKWWDIVRIGEVPRPLKRWIVLYCVTRGTGAGSVA